MKKTLVLTLSVVGLLLSASSAFAAEKEVTIKGEAQCAKCSLKKADKCTNVIVAKEDGKEVTYYVAKNEYGDHHLPHKLICQATKKVEAKGTVKEVNGKKEVALASIKISD
ncbi:MAG: hypothetical protein FJ398_16470 [Verrucomicrobia bacterium]|nr:hypothetical protein [Verrucomicrobiota bacterium]